MPVEIEAKLKVDSLAPTRDRLKATGAAYVGQALETNVFFDTDDRSLLAADRGLRLRRTRDLSSNAEKYVITLKGPRQHGPLKSRDETELTVASFDDAIALLEQLGFAQVLSFEKRRETWKLEGCSVELDELPLLGTFVEIEGPREEVVLRVRQTLGLSDRPIVKASYIAMLMTHLQEHGQAGRNVVFESTNQ
ncbi:MAG: class IV adenylate cyclase [Tepidisphaeraceae bacterium]